MSWVTLTLRGKTRCRREPQSPPRPVLAGRADNVLEFFHRAVTAIDVGFARQCTQQYRVLGIAFTGRGVVSSGAAYVAVAR